MQQNSISLTGNVAIFISNVCGKVLIVDTHKIKVRHEVLLFFSKHITLLQTVEKCI